MRFLRAEQGKYKRTSDFLFYNGGAGNLLIYEKIIKDYQKISVIK